MTTQSVSRYVARHPEILQGEPIIAETITSVRAIVELSRLGITSVGAGSQKIFNSNL